MASARNMLLYPLVLALSLAGVASSDAREVGLDGDTRVELFGNIAKTLDNLQIDVDHGRTADHALDGRRRLARLDGFPFEGRVPAQSDWTADFEQGRVGVMVAVREADNAQRTRFRQAKADTATSLFAESWHKASADDRVFLAFTREDAKAAQQIRKALEKEGFIVFTYIREPGAAPWTTGKAVGRYFETAAHHYVVDSKSARSSSGVVFEAMILQRRKAGGRGPNGPGPGAKNPGGDVLDALLKLCPPGN